MWTKSIFAASLLFCLISSSPAASSQGFTDVFVLSNFLDPEGNTAVVVVERSTSFETGVTTTRMAYSFCLQTTASQCEEGSGEIPMSNFTGQLSTNVGQPTKLTLLADTSKVSDYSNSLCINPSEGFCSSVVPASGGVVSVTFSKTVDSASVFNTQGRSYENRVLASTTSEQQAGYSCSMVGTVLAIPAQSPASQCQLSFDSLITHITQATAPVANQPVESSKHQRLESLLNSEPQGQKTLAWLKRVGMLP